MWSDVKSYFLACSPYCVISQSSTVQKQNKNRYSIQLFDKCSNKILYAYDMWTMTYYTGHVLLLLYKQREINLEWNFQFSLLFIVFADCEKRMQFADVVTWERVHSSFIVGWFILWLWKFFVCAWSLFYLFPSNYLCEMTIVKESNHKINNNYKTYCSIFKANG